MQTPKIKVSGGTVTINIYNRELSNSGELDDRSVASTIGSTKNRTKDTPSTQPEKSMKERVVDAKALLERQRKHLEARKETFPSYKRLINSSKTIYNGYSQTNIDLLTVLKNDMFATKEQKRKLEKISTDIESCYIKIGKYSALYSKAYKATSPKEGTLAKICTETEKQVDKLRELTEEFTVLMLEIKSANEKEYLEELIGFGFEENLKKGIPIEKIADAINQLSLSDYLQISAILEEKQLAELHDSAVEDELAKLEIEEAIETVTAESNAAIDQLNAVGDVLARPLGEARRRAPAPLPAPSTPQYGLYDYTVGPLVNGFSYMIYGSADN